MQVLLGNPVQFRLGQPLRQGCPVDDLQRDLVLWRGPLLQIVPQPGRNVLDGEDEDPVDVRPLGADGPDVALEFCPQAVPLDGAGEHDDVGGGQRKEPDRERQLGGQVSTEGLEVASLIPAVRHRPVAGTTLLAMRRLATWRHRCSNEWCSLSAATLPRASLIIWAVWTGLATLTSLCDRVGQPGPRGGPVMDTGGRHPSDAPRYPKGTSTSR